MGLELGEPSREWQQGWRVWREEQIVKDSEDHCQVIWVYFRCKGKLQTGPKPESGIMQFIFQRLILLPIVWLVTHMP